MGAAGVTSELILLNAAIALAGVVQASAGLGFAMVANPLIALINIAYLPGPMLFANLFLSSAILWREGLAVERREIPPLVTGLLIGTTLGALILTRYGVIILCFMSGVLWGFATKASGAQATACYVLSVIPALWAFLNPGTRADEALINLMIGFAGVLILDFAFARWGLAPKWWMTLRVPVTGVVISCLAIGAFA